MNENEAIELQQRYERGGEGHGHFKLYLHDVIWEYFRPYRDKREYFENNQDEVREILAFGASKARNIAMPIIEKVRQATGIQY